MHSYLVPGHPNFVPAKWFGLRLHWQIFVLFEKSSSTEALHAFLGVLVHHSPTSSLRCARRPVWEMYRNIVGRL